MNLLDPTLGGKVRTLIQALSAVAAVLAVYKDVPKVAVALTVISTLISVLTHLTSVGNVTPTDTTVPVPSAKPSTPSGPVV